MAKRSTKVKKPTEEQPALHMIIEKGRLVPAFPLDYERLDSYRNGTKMLVWMSTDGDRPLIRRWWATIGNYVKHTTLPWGDRETASAAIKLALAMVVPFKMPSGQWSQYPRSLADLDDTEIEAKILEMEQLLFDLTGVDVVSLRQGGSFGDEPFETNQPANDAGNETLADDPNACPPQDVVGEEGASAGAESPPPPIGTGATDSEIASPPVAGTESGAVEAMEPSPEGEDSPNSPGESGPAPDDGGGAVPTAAPPPTELSAEDRVWLKQGAKMMLACLPAHDPESYRVLIGQLKAIRAIMPNGISDAALSKMEAIRLHCTAVCKGEAELAKTLVARMALCEVADIAPDPVKVRDA